MPGSGLRTIEPRSKAGWLVSREKGLLPKIVSGDRTNSWQRATVRRKDNGGEI